MNLIDYGWNDKFKNEFEKLNEKDYIPARVIRQEKRFYQIQCEYGEIKAEVLNRRG